MSFLRGVRVRQGKLCGFVSIVMLCVFLSIPSVFAESWQATFKIRVLSQKRPTIHFSGKIYRHDSKVRLETQKSDEIDLYDFDAETETRIFPADQIYFVKDLALAKKIKALKEAWAPVRAPFVEHLLFLNDGEVNGKAAKLYLVKLEKDGQIAHLFRWMSDDGLNLPLRVIYLGSGHETIIADYEHFEAEPQQSLFLPPEDYLSLNPF